MAFSYGFYNSQNGDRKYNAEQMSAIFDGIINDGVYANIGEHFDVTPGSGLGVAVGTGRAWFNHTWNVNDSRLPLKIDRADVYYARIDAVILEVDARTTSRTNAIKVIEGTPSASPEKPALVNDETERIYQYPLAYVTVAKGATAITAADIEKMVGRDPCPFVTGPLEVVDITTLFNQWNGQFDAWFSHLQESLSGDVAANLQRQIDDINATLAIMNEHVGLMTVTVKIDGSPVSNVEIDNVFTTPNGSTKVKTDQTGVAKGYVAEGSQTIGISGYLDFGDVTKQFNISQAAKYEHTFNLTPVSFLKIISTKNNVRLSSNVSKVDVTVVGGGGGGGRGDYQQEDGGGGGGGGAVVVRENASFVVNTRYNAVVGAGGNSSLNGSYNGGASSFLGINAPGGSRGNDGGTAGGRGGAGGTPNGGNGGNGGRSSSISEGTPATNGGDGFQGYDTADSLTYYGGAGGGGQARYSGLGATPGPGTGGLGGGGAGARRVTTGTPTAGADGVENTGGGGGGGSYRDSNSESSGGKGGSGIIVVRLTLKRGGSGDDTGVSKPVS